MYSRSKSRLVASAPSGKDAHDESSPPQPVPHYRPNLAAQQHIST